MAISRREFLMSSGATAAQAAQGSRRRPNFIVILADDLGYADLGCYGGRTPTPNIDALAAGGVRFTDCNVPMPFCAPSRASLLTGLYPFRHGLWWNPAPDNGLHVGMSLAQTTLAEALKPQGYKSACIGKWHLGHTEESLPRKQGFDEYYGIPYSNDMRPVQILENEQVAQYPVVQGQITGAYTRRALSLMERNQRDPFFLYLAHAMPHKPLAVSEAFDSRRRGQLYADAIRELDWSVGQVMKKSGELGIEKETVVVFLSDNGAWFGGSSGGLRGMKARPWEGGLRIPMIVQSPGRFNAGKVCREMCSVMDLFPTFMKLAGAPADRVSGLDGKDIAPLLTQGDARSPHEALFAMSGGNVSVVRSGRWKLHVQNPGTTRTVVDRPGWVDPRGPDGITIIAQHGQAGPGQHPGVETGDAAKPMMLFDLAADAAEQKDVAAGNPEVVTRLMAYYERVQAQVPKTPAARPLWQGLRMVKGGNLSYTPGELVVPE
jgi:uncharacterized sulfatase